MKILGTEPLAISNAEVLAWTKKKRAQHDREDAEDRTAGITPAPRPQNFMKSLEKHESHLKSDAYPYEKNPSAYEGKNQDDSHLKFQDATMTKIQEPLVERYKDAIRKKLMTVPEAKAKLEEEQEKKELTDAEITMIANHAPMYVEMLQPMIEDVEERFTLEEQQAIVECIKEVYRVDEMKGQEMEVDEKEPPPM